ncbi:MAG TPA: acyl-CoA dehydrogenase family protein [Thermodesulfobacteriota bacterium]|nr:acyl-CoA dehydrogenase family protein [Thermodesulfobacteriota bacterium]
MNFDLTDEQKDIMKAAREFAEKEFPGLAQECDREEKSPRPLWEKASKLGFVGVFIPEVYGGQGLGFLEHCLINEEFWRVDPGIAHFILAGTFGSEIILLFGTEEQKRKWVPPLVKAQAITGAAITEPDAGSDVSSVRTAATLDGNDYVINGTKTFITGGTLADYLLVLCVTEPHAKSRHDRFSVIIVETNRKGFDAAKLKHKLGLRASDTAEISFSDVRVPKENLVGTPGRGFQQFMVFFDHTRLHVAAEAVGLAQGAMEQAIKYARKREQFGKPLASFQVTQFKIAEMATRIEAGRNLYQKAAWFLDHGKVESHLISMAKWYTGETAVKVAEEALQLHGGYGFIGDYDIERFYRDSKIVEIYEGTKEIEKTIIARELLGKY